MYAPLRARKPHPELINAYQPILIDMSVNIHVDDDDTGDDDDNNDDGLDE